MLSNSAQATQREDSPTARITAISGAPKPNKPLRTTLVRVGALKLMTVPSGLRLDVDTVFW